MFGASDGSFSGRSKCSASLVAPYLLFMVHVYVCYPVLSVPYCLVVTCCERTDLLALFYVVFSFVFVTFPYGVQGQVWYSIVSISDLCLLLYFETEGSLIWHSHAALCCVTE